MSLPDVSLSPEIYNSNGNTLPFGTTTVRTRFFIARPRTRSLENLIRQTYTGCVLQKSIHADVYSIWYQNEIYDFIFQSFCNDGDFFHVLMWSYQGRARFYLNMLLSAGGFTIRADGVISLRSQRKHADLSRREFFCQYFELDMSRFEECHTETDLLTWCFSSNPLFDAFYVDCLLESTTDSLHEMRRFCREHKKTQKHMETNDYFFCAFSVHALVLANKLPTQTKEKEKEIAAEFKDSFSSFDLWLESPSISHEIRWNTFKTYVIHRLSK